VGVSAALPADSFHFVQARTEAIHCGWRGGCPGNKRTGHAEPVASVGASERLLVSGHAAGER